MDNLIQQLGSNEAVLMMYLSGELPADDRAEVEQMLAQDAGMRAELERLREGWEGIEAGLSDADRGLHSASMEAAAIRNASGIVRQWQVHRAVAAAKEAREAASGQGHKRLNF